MKKFMALCLSVLMVLSMCSFTVMAEGEVDFSVIANGQPQNFVVGNLSLNGNSITSSNEAVIALDGAVTRPLFEDEIVTIGVGSSSYDVTVKSMMINPANYTDFTVTDETTVEAFAGFSENPDNSTTLKDGIAELTLTGNSNNLRFSFPETTAQSADRAIEFKVASMDNTDSTDMIDVRPIICYYDADGKLLGEISGSSVFRASKANTFSDYTNTGLGAITSGIIKIKVENSELYIGNNSGAYVKVVSTNNYWGISKFEGATKAVLSGVYIRGGSGSATGTVRIDDAVSYEMADASEILLGATPQQKLNYFSKYLEADYVAGDGSLAFAAGSLNLTADIDLASYGASLVWEEQAGTDAVAEDGKLKAALDSIIETSITGTLAVANPDGEPLTKVVTHNVTVAPQTVEKTSEMVDFDSYGLADGANLVEVVGWSNKATNAFSATNAVDSGNNVGKLVANGTTSWDYNALSYTFANAPAISDDTAFYVMKARVKVTEYTNNNNSVRFGLRINDKDAGIFLLRGGKMQGSKLVVGNEWHTAATNTSGKTYVSIPTDGYIDIMVKVDLTTRTVYYIQDNEVVGTTTYGTGESADTYNPDFTNISSARFALTARTDAATILVDDLMLYTEKSKDAAIAEMDEKDRVAYFKNIVKNAKISSNTIGVDENLNLTSSYSEYDLSACGVEINWASSEPTVVSDEGMITPAATVTPTDVVMTATIKAGNESDTVTFPIQVAQANSTGFTISDLEQSFDDASARPAPANSTYVDVEGRGSVLKITNETGSQIDANIANYPGYSAGNTFADRFYISADINYTRQDGGNYAIFGFLGNQGTHGGEAHINFVKNTIELTTKTVVAGTAGTGINYSDGVVEFPMPESVKQGEWMNITIDYNALSQTYQVYINGTLINDVPMLRAVTEKATSNVPFRGIVLALSAQGEMMVDNLTVRKSSDSAKNEVNAALNAALLDYAAEWYHPVLTNRELRANTIGASFALAGGYDIDDSDKFNNPALYKYTTDGPAITYALGETAVTKIEVAAPTTAKLTITSSKDGISESKTVTRKIAPVAVRDLGHSDSALNGIWLEGASGAEKVVVASYNGDSKLVALKLFNLSDTNNVAFDASTGILSGISGVQIPSIDENVTHIKVMVVDANGVIPVAFANTELTD